MRKGIKNGFLQSDLDAAGFQILNLTGGGGGGAGVFNILDYGAKADVKQITDISMPQGSVITSAATVFTNADVGKLVVVRGASGATDGKSPLNGTITAVNGNSATLSQPNAWNGLATEAESFPMMTYGSDCLDACYLALLAVPAVGGTVFIPTGNYIMISTNARFWAVVRDNIKIMGGGMGGTKIFYTSAYQKGIFFAGALENPNPRPKRNLIVSDFTISDLNYYIVDTTGNNGLDFLDVSDLTIERIEAVNCKGNACINVQGRYSNGGPVTNRIKIRDCYIHGDREGGAISFFDYGIQGDGINAGQLNDVEITGNVIVGTGRHAYEGGGVCYDQYFANNHIDMLLTGKAGINPTGGNRTTVAHNIIKNVTRGEWAAIDFTTDEDHSGLHFFAKDINIIGNYITGKGQYMIRCQNTSYNAEVNHVDRVLITANYAEAIGGQTGCSGVGLGGVAGGGPDWPDIVIANNTFKVDTAAVQWIVQPATDANKFLVVKDNFIGSAEIITGLVNTPQGYCKQLLFENNRGTRNYTLNGGGRYGHKVKRDGFANGALAAGAAAVDEFFFYGGVVGLDRVIVTPAPDVGAGIIITAWLILEHQQDNDQAKVKLRFYNPTAAPISTGSYAWVTLHRENPCLPFGST